MNYNYLINPTMNKKLIIKELNRKVGPLEQPKHYYLVTTYFGSKAAAANYFESYEDCVIKCAGTKLPTYFQSKDGLVELTNCSA